MYIQASKFSRDIVKNTPRTERENRQSISSYKYLNENTGTSTAKRKLERLQFSTSSSFVKI